MFLVDLHVGFWLWYEIVVLFIHLLVHQSLNSIHNCNMSTPGQVVHIFSFIFCVDLLRSKDLRR